MEQIQLPTELFYLCIDTNFWVCWKFVSPIDQLWMENINKNVPKMETKLLLVNSKFEKVNLEEHK